MDIANHIISERGYRRPETYSEIFQILGEEKVLSPELSESMQNMANSETYWYTDTEKSKTEKCWE